MRMGEKENKVSPIGLIRHYLLASVKAPTGWDLFLKRIYVRGAPQKNEGVPMGVSPWTQVWGFSLPSCFGGPHK